MKHGIVVVESNSSILSGALEVGQFAVITASHMDEKGHIVAKIYGGVVVDLNNPEMTWDHSYKDDGFNVRPLQKGDTFTVSIGNGEEELLKAVKQFLDDGQKINAIKRVREVLNLGLKEAKDYVDKIDSEYVRVGAPPAVSSGRYDGKSW